MFNHIKQFAQLSSYLLIGTLSLFGLMTILGTGDVGRASAAFQQQEESSDDAMAVPMALNYQGILRDGDGNLIADGQYDVTLNIYGSVKATIPIFTQEQPSIAARGGRFGTTIENIPPEVFSDGKDRFLGVVVNGVEMLPRERLASVPYAVQAEYAYDAFNGVPVGGVVDWWRPDNSVPMPAGYMLCDGSEVTDPDSPYLGQVTPDLIGQIVRGATPGQGGNERTFGGSATQTIQFANGSTVAQTITTAQDGAHTHDITGHTGPISTEDHGDPGDQDFWVTEFNQGWVQGGHILAEPNDARGEGNHYHSKGTLNTATAGLHDHDVNVPALSLSGSQTIDTLPPHTNLLKICRIR